LKDFFFSDKPVDSGFARVENKGAYLARVLVRFQNPQGEEQLRNSGTYPVFQSRLIEIDDNAKEIEIEVQVDLFINKFQTIFKTNNACPQTRCFVVWGTIFSTGWSEVCC
jgi:hypothetical protein